MEREHRRGMSAHTYNFSTQEAEAGARGEFKANKTTVRQAGLLYSGIISECSNFLQYENIHAGKSNIQKGGWGKGLHSNPAWFHTHSETLKNNHILLYLNMSFLH